MTAPTGKGDVEAPAVLDVVGFLHEDPILGGSRPAVGVVVVAGSQLTVRPLAGHFLQLDPAAVHVLTAADLGKDSEA